MQKLKSAEKFYDTKVEELGANLKDLELIVQRKQTNARTIEEGKCLMLFAFAFITNILQS